MTAAHALRYDVNTNEWAAQRLSGTTIVAPPAQHAELGGSLVLAPKWRWLTAKMIVTTHRSEQAVAASPT
jgi:hypothetical protein